MIRHSKDKTNKKTTSIDVVIPVFNSEKTLPYLLDSIIALKLPPKYRLGVILVNDGSSDSSLSVCRFYQTKHHNIKVVNLTRNFGQHPALIAGMSKSESDLLITMDDDGQHIPETIPVLLEELDHETDVVYGVAIKDEHSFLRNLASKLFKSFLFRILGIRNAKSTSAFRLIRRDVFKTVNFDNLAVGFLEILIDWNTSRIKSIPVPMRSRAVGRSNYSFFELIKLSFRIIANYSLKPLRLATYTGVIGFILSITSATYFLYQSISGQIQVQGFASTIIVVSILGSAQLICLGIIGEYLGRLHERNLGKPSYVIRESE